ncbi:MAG: Gfo/Idh/MocA family oxidoreductase [Thermoguttaceae bacterium]|jgi:predicted dehydrogenase
MAIKITRRSFVKTATVAGAALAAQPVAAPYVLADPAPGKKLGVAVVGVGGMGGYSFGAAMGERLVAICDVDDKIIAGALKQFHDSQKGRPEPKVFYDYRKMLDAVHQDVDAVLIATPDHNHAPAAIRAIRRGKATFSQKPLAHNIYECRTLAEAAKQNKVLTQLGNQGHCGEGYRRLVECIWGGAIGTVKETHSIFARDFGGSGGIPPGKPVPAGLHWDEWLGPAPYRNYHDGLHTFSWRNWRQFGTGTLGDMACHVMDGVFWALRLQEVKAYSIECLAQKGGSAEMFPQSNVLKFEYPARGDMPPVKVCTYDNSGQKPQIVKDVEKLAGHEINDGTVYVGEKGYMLTDTYGGGVRILPETRQKEFPLPEKTLVRAHGGPIEDLFWAVKNNGTPCSNFADYSGPFTEMILTGQLAMFAGPGKKVEWDVAAMKCTNHDEMNRFVKRTYRPGWEV